MITDAQILTYLRAVDDGVDLTRHDPNVRLAASIGGYVARIPGGAKSDRELTVKGRAMVDDADAIGGGK